MFAGTKERIVKSIGRRGVQAAALAALVAGTLLGGMTAPAAAHDGWDRGGWDRGGWGRERWQEREWREHRHHRPPPRVIYAPPPPVIYAPPPRVVYAPPPPVVYAPPPSFGFRVDIPLR